MGHIFDKDNVLHCFHLHPIQDFDRWGGTFLAGKCAKFMWKVIRYNSNGVATVQSMPIIYAGWMFIALMWKKYIENIQESNH